MPKIVSVIPARGGSKGIPRKNLRNLAGHPLIYYPIRNCLQSRHEIKPFVSTEDPEIAAIARRLGAEVIDEVPRENTSLDPVIEEAAKHVGAWDRLVVLQPTSPGLTARTLDAAIDKSLDEINEAANTIVSVVRDTHLRWGDGGRPLYAERQNRQYLPAEFKETGAFTVSRRLPRWDGGVRLFEVPEAESIDIDTDTDWAAAEYLLTRKTVAFVVDGSRKAGTGHVYRCLTLAQDLTGCEIVFVTDDSLAWKMIADRNFRVESGVPIGADLVVYDCLHVDQREVYALRSLGSRVAVFEQSDIEADLVVNELLADGERCGPEWAVLRDEFLLARPVDIEETPQRVLLCFGGSDPQDYTRRVIDAIHPWCQEHNLWISALTGPGYPHSLEDKPVTWIHDISCVSEIMLCSDVAITSAGRTTYELAALGIPSIVLTQNEREESHAHARGRNGFAYMGRDADKVLPALVSIVKSRRTRQAMQRMMLAMEVRGGRRRVIKELRRIMEG